MTLDDIVVPETAAAGAALEVARRYCSPALLNHSVRSYLWAAAHGAMGGIEFDAELLYVAAMLHDLGLVDEFDSHVVPFEEAGGHVAWVFGAGAGWSPERRQRVAEVIVRHMWDRVDVASDPEGHLLELGTAVDISGRSVDAYPPALRAAVLERWPRLALPTEFAACIRAQAARKPESAAARFVRSGIEARLAANALDAPDVR